MASGTEGIALLSLYNDEEEEEEDDDYHHHHLQHQQQQGDGDDADVDTDDVTKPLTAGPACDSTDAPPPDLSRSPQNVSSSPSPEVKSLRSPTPPPWPKSQRLSPLDLVSPSPTPPPLPRPPTVERRGAVAIVDYGHDEPAMSPEAEEGEIVSAGQVVVGLEVRDSDKNFEEQTPPGSVQLLTPSTQPDPPQPSELPEQSRSETSMAIDSTGTEPEIAQAELATVVSEEVQIDDPMRNFLPPPVMTKCNEELQERISKFLAYKKSGKSFNEALRNSKDYRNPDFLQHAVRYQDIDQIGTCFNKDVFDPHGYDKSDYYDEIEADMKREIERKEQERKKSQKVDFVSGGTQPGTVIPALKINTQIPVAGVASGLQTVASAADSTRESRQNKKTKWDKVDGDNKNPLNSSGNDNISAVGVHAAHLSAANAGAGYTAFALQKRREAEEKRSGERKFDRRS